MVRHTGIARAVLQLVDTRAEKLSTAGHGLVRVIDIEDEFREKLERVVRKVAEAHMVRLMSGTAVDIETAFEDAMEFDSEPESSEAEEMNMDEEEAEQSIEEAEESTEEAEPHSSQTGSRPHRSPRIPHVPFRGFDRCIRPGSPSPGPSSDIDTPHLTIRSPIPIATNSPHGVARSHHLPSRSSPHYVIPATGDYRYRDLPVNFRDTHHGYEVLHKLGDGSWVELGCVLCDATTPPNTYAGNGRFFDGIKGLRNHISKYHPWAWGEAGPSLEHCISKRLTKKEIRQVRSGRYHVIPVPGKPLPMVQSSRLSGTVPQPPQSPRYESPSSHVTITTQAGKVYLPSPRPVKVRIPKGLEPYNFRKLPWEFQLKHPDYGLLHKDEFGDWMESGCRLCDKNSPPNMTAIGDFFSGLSSLKSHIAGFHKDVRDPQSDEVAFRHGMVRILDNDQVKLMRSGHFRAAKVPSKVLNARRSLAPNRNSWEVRWPQLQYTMFEFQR